MLYFKFDSISISHEGKRNFGQKKNFLLQVQKRTPTYDWKAAANYVAAAAGGPAANITKICQKAEKLEKYRKMRRIYFM